MSDNIESQGSPMEESRESTTMRFPSVGAPSSRRRRPITS